MHTEEEQDAPAPDATAATFAEYAAVASQYDASFQMIYRTESERPSMLQAVGAVQGLRVLDLASGTGHYTRLLRHAGAAHVVGVDLSPDMIAVAQQAEAQEPLGITYLVRDVAELEVLDQPFDLAVAVYLLHYATSQQHLQQMCQCIARNLRPGGRFVTATISPVVSAVPGYYRKYSLDVFAAEGMQAGTRYSFAFMVGDAWVPPVSVSYWSWDALEGAFQQAGFGPVRRIPLSISDKGLQEQVPGFWDDILSRPFAVILEAERAG